MSRIADPQQVVSFEYDAGHFEDDAELNFEPTRWYSPDVGVWMSEEAIQFAGGENLTCYVGNPPEQPDASDPLQI